MSVAFHDPFADFNRLFDHAFTHWSAVNSSAGQHDDPQNGSSTRSFRPRLDVHHDGEKNAVTVNVDLPGMKKEDVHIDVHNGQLMISGETAQDTERSQDGWVVRERRSGRFSRSIPLPQGVRAEQVTAALNDGVLTVTFPKETEEQKARRITVA